MKYWIFSLLLGLSWTVTADSSGHAPTKDEHTFQAIKGKKQALARLSELLKQLGGRSLWANAKSLQVIQRTRSPRIGDGILTMTWHNLEAPGEWGDIQHAKFTARYAWSEDGGWLRKDGEYRDYIGDEVAEKVFYWRRNLYTLYHRLAKDELEYSVESIKPYGLLVRDPDFEKVAELHLTADGEIYRWRLLGAKKEHGSVFGPYKSFGQARFPDWVTSADGQWGAYQIHVMPSPIPFEEQVSLRKPVREWQGGAVQNNCENIDSK